MATKAKTLSDHVSRNLKMALEEHDLSTNELSKRSGVPQRTIYSVIKGEHSPTIDTVEKLAKALLIDSSALMVADVPMSVLQSRRLRKIIEAYRNMSHSERDAIEAIIERVRDRELTADDLVALAIK